MSAEVDFVLSAIQNNYGTVGVAVVGHSKVINSLADVPLQRIDRDNSANLDDGGFVDQEPPIHTHSEELAEMNYIGAASATRQDTPLGASYDLKTERIVSVRVEGMHVEEWGAIDPRKGTAQETPTDYPTITWQDLLLNVRRSILIERTFPQTTTPQAAFKDLFIENFNDQASQFSDYYLATFDVRFSGFETLPDP